MPGGILSTTANSWKCDLRIYHTEKIESDTSRNVDTFSLKVDGNGAKCGGETNRS